MGKVKPYSTSVNHLLLNDAPAGRKKTASGETISLSFAFSRVTRHKKPKKQSICFDRLYLHEVFSFFLLHVSPSQLFSLRCFYLNFIVKFSKILTKTRAKSSPAAQDTAVEPWRWTAPVAAWFGWGFWCRRQKTPRLSRVILPSGYVTKTTQWGETEGLRSMKHSPWTRLLLADTRITHLHISEAFWRTMCPKWKTKRRKHNLVISMARRRWVCYHIWIINV